MFRASRSTRIRHQKVAETLQALKSYMTTSLQPNRKVTSSSFMLEALFRSVPVLVEGVRTNFFGLGCPIYCTQPGVASLLLVLVIGGLLGFCSCLLVLWTFWTHLRSDLPAPLTWCPPSSTASPSRYSALAGYWNERGPNVCLWEESHPHCR